MSATHTLGRFGRAGVSLTLWLAACGVGARPADETPSYFPMEANRLWEYRLSDLGRDHVWPIAVRSRGPEFVPALGRVAAIFDEEYPDQVLPVAFFLSEGFLQSEIGLGYGGENRMGVLPIGTQPMRVMPVPPEVGMRWAYSEDVFGRSGSLDHGFVIHWSGGIYAEESVEVPAGIFRNCLRIESIALHRTRPGEDSREYRYIDWYAPEIGLVKSEYALGERTILTRMELVRFDRGPATPWPAHPHMRMAFLAPARPGS